MKIPGKRNGIVLVGNPKYGKSTLNAFVLCDNREKGNPCLSDEKRGSVLRARPIRNLHLPICFNEQNDELCRIFMEKGEVGPE